MKSITGRAQQPARNVSPSHLGLRPDWRSLNHRDERRHRLRLDQSRHTEDVEDRNDSTELGGIAILSLREWRNLKVVRDTLNEMVREKLAGATEKLVEATPRIADMLNAVALDDRSTPYSLFAAADLVFRTVATNLLVANQQEQIAAIREQLEQFEIGGPVVDV